jgi:hypothetical protein
MDTNEHTELGNLIRIKDWSVLEGNPFINFDENDTLLLDLQGIDEQGFPVELEKLTRIPGGVLLGMSGDYFGGKEVDFDLPTLAQFNQSPETYSNSISLGHFFTEDPVTDMQRVRLICSYDKLTKSSHEEIETIYKINNANYIPFSSTLNFYMQQLMFALRVKNYGEMLNRNLSHFTPWSVRTYVIGHHLALRYAHLHYEFKKLSENKDYESKNEEFKILCKILQETSAIENHEFLLELAHRYQALALGMELFCFHYYSDHFAAGHGSFMGDLRSLLPERFGTFGSILVNNLHDEANRVTIYTYKPYDINANRNEQPVEAGGDGDFDNPDNAKNKQACLDGMHASLEDLHAVFRGENAPEQEKYAGLPHLPDVAPDSRQTGPLFILGNDNIIYYRTNLRKINILSPGQLDMVYEKPLENGYSKLTSKWTAFVLVVKLRLFSYFYQGKVVPLTAEQLRAIEKDERARNPDRIPIPTPKVAPENKPTPAPMPASSRPKPATSASVMEGLNVHGILSPKSARRTEEDADLTAGARIGV